MAGRSAATLLRPCRARVQRRGAVPPLQPCNPAMATVKHTCMAWHAWHGMHGMHRPRSARFARRQLIQSALPVGRAQSVSPSVGRAGRAVVVLASGSVPSGANSSVGAAVIQLAALRGINTINIVRRRPEPENSAVSARLLVAFTVPYRASCIVCRVASCTGGSSCASEPRPRLRTQYRALGECSAPLTHS